ncbi:MAG: hypothetical protein OWU33_13575 [Firmicutes bacterium]|nr:hypothetical protein [Bacillota bacterium]
MNRLIGVDFGTSNSLASIRFEDGSILAVPGEKPLPSIAARTSRGNIQFHDADSPPAENLIVHSKLRLVVEQKVTRTLEWVNEPAHLTPAYDPTNYESNAIEHSETGWRVVTRSEFLEPFLTPAARSEAKAATVAILRELKQLIDARLGLNAAMDTDDIIVFGVPARALQYRYLLKTLAQRAGWPLDNNFRVFPEPFAALLALLEGDPKPGSYLVLDIGGGTSDWALVRVSRTAESRPEFALVDSLSHPTAGSHVDHEIALALLDPHTVDTLSPMDWRRLEEAKIRVSLHGSHDTRMGDTFILGGQRVTLDWALIARCAQRVFDRRVLAEGRAYFAEHAIDYVLVTGGGADTPGLRELAEHHFGPKLLQLEPGRASKPATAKGLILSQQQLVLSSVEHNLAFVEYPSQTVHAWVEAFAPLAPDSTLHTKYFQFQETPGHIPLLLADNEDWMPIGYLKVPDGATAITPIWDRRHGLTFINQRGESLEWIHEPYPFLRLHTPVRYQNNHLKNQSKDGVGVVTQFLKVQSPVWVGSTEQLIAEVKSAPTASVKVQCDTQDWTWLDFGTKRFLTQVDLHTLNAVPLATTPIPAFREIDRDEWEAILARPLHRSVGIRLQQKLRERLQRLDARIARLESVIQQLRL